MAAGPHGGNINLGSATLTTGALSTTDNFCGIISGTGGLTKTGNGTMILSGTNTYTGTTTVSGGTLQAGIVTSAFGGNSAVTLANTAGVTLNLNNFSNTIGSLNGGGTTGGNVTLGSATLTTGALNTADSYGGVISGTGALIKTGTGTMTLSGINTYTGGTTISSGALSVASSSALGLESNLLTIGGGATLDVTSSFNTSRGTTLGGTGGGNGGTFDVASGQTLDYTSSGVISGSGSLIKTDTGTLILEGVNTYTGDTYIQAGTLVLTSDQAAGPQPLLGSPLYALHIYNGATVQIGVSSF